MSPALSKSVSVFNCDGRLARVPIEASARAVARSAHIMGVGGVMCSHLKPETPLGDVEWRQIGPLTLAGYNRWMIQEPIKHVTTEFGLFVQNDGFVVNPSAWTDEFLQYDYIGAPWPGHEPWRTVNQGRRVGNGGFSLRSRRLLELTSRFNLEEVGGHPEDNFICIVKRNELESKGIKFAPVELAASFSVENPIEEFDIFARPSFGFHGKANNVTMAYCASNW